MMYIELSPTDAGYIKLLVENGLFSSEEEAVTATIKSAREKYEIKRERLIKALRAGEEDIKAGRTIPYTPELLDQIFEEGMKAVECGETLEFDTDVIP